MSEAIKNSSKYALASLIAVALFATGCGDSDKGADTASFADENPVPTAKAGPTEVSTIPIQIYTGTAESSGSSGPATYVVRSERQLTSLLKKLGAEETEDKISIPDFKTSQLVVAAIPPATLGTQLTISNVTPKNGSSFDVETVVLSLGEGCKKGSKKTALFTVVQTERVEGEPKLKLEKKRQSPC